MPDRWFNSSYIILMMIAVCACFLLAFIFHKQLKYVLRFLLKSGAGTLGIFSINALFSFIGFNLSIGINFMTLLIVGILGIPGFLTLYIAGLLL